MRITGKVPCVNAEIGIDLFKRDQTEPGKPLPLENRLAKGIGRYRPKDLWGIPQFYLMGGASL